MPEAVCCWWLPWKPFECHGGDVVCVFTEFHSNNVLPLACYNDEQFYQETLPEAICCCLQTCLLLIFIPLIEYIMYTKLCSHI